MPYPPETQGPLDGLRLLRAGLAQWERSRFTNSLASLCLTLRRKVSTSPDSGRSQMRLWDKPPIKAPRSPSGKLFPLTARRRDLVISGKTKRVRFWFADLSQARNPCWRYTSLVYSSWKFNQTQNRVVDAASTQPSVVKREEKRDPALRVARLEKNKPLTLDQKRVWDDVDDDELTSSVDLQALRRRRIQQAEDADRQMMEATQLGEDRSNEDDEDADSMLDSDEDEDERGHDEAATSQSRPRQNSLAPSIASTSNLDLTPESLIAKFPSLFSDNSRPQEPKILITTGLDSTLHHVARTFEGIIPNSKYVRRSAHKYGHKYSVREISKFAANRGFSSLLVIREDNKSPTGLDIIDLASGVTFLFSEHSTLRLHTSASARCYAYRR
ncbi:hypothetical protein GQX73_g6690 [Xylaria multiplex]|uniref:Brix domain-containing protein n=1 Tax=Xylaria multiplex TaxID=323545 RepID=A0A7C8ILS9_9PEZI|nr:hypothetical protein GQX73_g6690 [Xylaria multiplex]